MLMFKTASESKKNELLEEKLDKLLSKECLTSTLIKYNRSHPNLAIEFRKKQDTVF